MLKPKSEITYIRKGSEAGKYKVVRVTVRPDGTMKKSTIYKNIPKFKADDLVFTLNRKHKNK